jgi:hypothetical protein
MDTEGILIIQSYINECSVCPRKISTDVTNNYLCCAKAEMQYFIAEMLRIDRSGLP